MEKIQHQQGSFYKTSDNLGLQKIYGKNLSYNNYNDIYSALAIISSFKKNEGTVIIKHTKSLWCVCRKKST